MIKQMNFLFEEENEEEKVFDTWAYEHLFNDWDYLALEFKEADSKRQGEIVEMVCKNFENLVIKKINLFVTRNELDRNYYFDEGMAIWRQKVFERLTKWTGGESTKYDFVNFMAYIVPVADKLVVSELNEKYAFKEARSVSTFDQYVGDIVDSFNQLGNDDSHFIAYEMALMSKAFKPIWDNIEDMALQVVVDYAIEEIGGFYNPVDRSLYDIHNGSLRHFGEV